MLRQYPQNAYLNCQALFIYLTSATRNHYFKESVKERYRSTSRKRIIDYLTCTCNRRYNHHSENHMQLQENISLRPYNTFGIEAKARYFAPFTTLSELEELCSYGKENIRSRLILGGGSNVLLTKVL